MNRMFEKCSVNLFPEELKTRMISDFGMGNNKPDEGIFIRGLTDEMLVMYENNLMPHESDVQWAAQSVDLGNLVEYKEFKDKNPAFRRKDDYKNL